MKTRRAKLDDVGWIADIHVRSWQSAYKDTLPSSFLASLDVRQRAAMWRSCVENNGQVYVAVDDDSQIMGFLCLGAPRDDDLKESTELQAIYLDPKFYGSGIGTRFWKGIEKEITTDSVYLWVLSTNPIGLAFYEKNGFRTDGKRKTIEIGGQQFEELRYQKLLRS